MSVRVSPLTDQLDRVGYRDADGYLGECRSAPELKEIGDGSGVAREVGPVGENRGGDDDGRKREVESVSEFSS